MTKAHRFSINTYNHINTGIRAIARPRLVNVFLEIQILGTITSLSKHRKGPHFGANYGIITVDMGGIDECPLTTARQRPLSAPS